MGYLLTKNVSYEETCASQFFMETCYIEICNNYKKREFIYFFLSYISQDLFGYYGTVVRLATNQPTYVWQYNGDTYQDIFIDFQG